MRCTPSKLRRWYINQSKRVGVGIILILVGLIVAAIAGRGLLTDVSFWFEGDPVMGTVVAKHHVVNGGGPVLASVLLAHGGGKRPGYVVDYEFADAAGVVHRGSGRVSRRDWERLNPADPIEVLYLADDPTQNRPVNALRTPVEVGGLILTALLGGFGLVVSGFGWARRQAELVETGEPVLGVIDALDEQCGKNGIRSLRARYRYLAGAGDDRAVRTGTSIWLPERRVPGWKVGGPVLVLVSPESPTEHAADVFDARREDREQLLTAEAPQ